MARKTQPSTSLSQPANLTNDEVRQAIPLLERRIEELRNIRPQNDDDVSRIQDKLNDTVARIYPIGCIEQKRLHVSGMHSRIMVFGPGVDHSFGARRGDIDARIKSALSKFQTEVDLLKERLDETPESEEGRALRAYAGLKLHGEIERAASSRYRSGHYADAVESAVKALNSLVRLRSGLEQDGSALMQKTFGGDQPVLKFNDLCDASNKDEQRGFMMLFSGAVAGLRNPRAHGFIHDDPERALEFIAFVSLLAKLLDEAKQYPSD